MLAVHFSSFTSNKITNFASTSPVYHQNQNYYQKLFHSLRWELIIKEMAVSNLVSGKTMPYFDGQEIKVYQHPVPEASKEIIQLLKVVFIVFLVCFFFFFLML